MLARRRLSPLALTALLWACASRPPQPPTATVPAASSGPLAAPPSSKPREPRALYSVQAGVLAPVACFDGGSFLSTDSSACEALAPQGSAVAILGGGDGKILGKTLGKCMRGNATFDGRDAEGPKLDAADWAIWPASARSHVKPSDASVKPTAAEQKSLDELLAKAERELNNTEVTPPPKLAVNTGLVADMDGDGKPDRVFAGHEEEKLFGIVAVFLGAAPATPVVLSSKQFDYPKVQGTSDLDGNGHDEVLVDGAFVEAVEDSAITSGISVRVIALEAGKEPKLVGSWGCRRF